jgi:hypothetical protein
MKRGVSSSDRPGTAHARSNTLTVSSAPRDFEGPLPQLPQNLEAERSVLGAIILDNKALDVALGRITAGDFFLDAHKLIFSETIVLGAAREAIDLVTLTDRLHRSGKLEAAGGAAYLSLLVDGVPQVSNTDDYARIVKQKAVLRSLIHTAHSIQQQAFEEQEDPDTILTRAGASFESLRGSSSERNSLALFHTLEEFEMAQTASFSIEGFLQNDTATLIGGLSGHGKTLVALSLTKALLAGRGTRLWNLFDVKETAVRVIYLIPESPIGPFKHRLLKFGIYDALHPQDGRLLVRTLSKGATPSLSDPLIVQAAKGAHIILDTAIRFNVDGDENSAGDVMRGLATDIFNLLAGGARAVIVLHHAPKPFARQSIMSLENMVRGSGDYGAMVATAWGLRQLDVARNIVHIQNLKARDLDPCGPFQLLGRPCIDESGDFALYKRPGECGVLQDEQEPDREKGGGAPEIQRQAKASCVALMRSWLAANPSLTVSELSQRFKDSGVEVSRASIYRHLKDLNG